MKKFVNLISLVVLCVAVSGCFPYHYTTCPGLSGTVVNAVNHEPLAGANISFGGTNDTAIAFSASDGSFNVPPKRQWGIWIIPQDVFPKSWTVRIHHDGYETNDTHFLFRSSATGEKATFQLGIIPLKPELQ